MSSAVGTSLAHQANSMSSFYVPRATVTRWVAASLVLSSSNCFAEEAPRALVFPPSIAPVPIAPPPNLSTPVATDPAAAGPQTRGTVAPASVQLRILMPNSVKSVNVSSKEHKLSATCYKSCDLSLVPGDYLVMVSAKDGAVWPQILSLRNSAAVSVIPADPDTAALGLTLGIAGPVVVLSGLVVGFIATVAGNIDNEDGSHDVYVSPLAVGLLLGGAGMTAGGFVLYSSSNHPELREGPLVNTMSASEAIRVTVAPISSGVGMAASLAF